MAVVLQEDVAQAAVPVSRGRFREGRKLGGYFTGPEKSYFLRNLVANRFAIFFLNSFPLRKKKKITGH